MLRRSRILSTAMAASLLVPGIAFGQDFDFRLSPGPRLVGTRADSSGWGEVHAALNGTALTLEGKYQGLLAVPATAHLLMGSAPGVRGPKLADLTISSGTSGSISGKVKLSANQLAMFHKGGLYVEIDSAEAPDGDLWGWVLPPSD